MGQKELLALFKRNDDIPTRQERIQKNVQKECRSSSSTKKRNRDDNNSGGTKAKEDDPIEPSNKRAKRKQQVEEFASDAAALAEEGVRTLFIGSVPLELTPKELLLSLRVDKSKVASTRFRCMPVKPKWSKNRMVGVMKKDFVEGVGSKTAYVVFKEQACVEELIQKVTQEGETFSTACGAPLRLDRVRGSKTFSTFDRKRTVFVGGLPALVEEKVVQNHFSSVGEVKGVRIIRDKTTSECKGFGYVCFSERKSVRIATRELHDKPFPGVKWMLRVQVALSEEDAGDRKKKSLNQQPQKKAVKKILGSRPPRGISNKLIQKTFRHFAERGGGNK